MNLEINADEFAALIGGKLLMKEPSSESSAALLAGDADIGEASGGKIS